MKNEKTTPKEIITNEFGLPTETSPGVFETRP